MRAHLKRAHLRICLALAAELAGGRIHAAELTTEGTSSPRESPRALNGYVFQPSQLVTGPFSDTAFGMVTRFGSGDAEAPKYDLQGNQTGTKKYTVAAFGQDINADFRLTPDIALRLDVGGVVFTGVDGKGILVVGGTAQYGLHAGITAGRDLNPRMRLSFVADVGVDPQLSVLVGNAVLRAIQSRAFDGEGLFSKVERLATNPGVSFAWAPSPAVGFVAEARYVWTRRVSTEEESQSRVTQAFSLGGIAGLDLEPLAHVPIGVQLSYRADLPLAGGYQEVHQPGLGIYYTRRARLALGLETVWRHGRIRPGVEPTLKSDTVSAGIIFRYYW
jgi:hypothetical protein